MFKKQTGRERKTPAAVFSDGAMATIESCSYSFDRLITARAFKHARCYAPEAVVKVLAGVSQLQQLTLVIDVDSLERSALARVDRVMLLALDALARAGVNVVLSARFEYERATRLQLAIRGARSMDLREGAVVERIRAHSPDTNIIMVSDNPGQFVGLSAGDRGVALGRHELASSTVAAAGHGSIRATLWWLLEMRMRDR